MLMDNDELQLLENISIRRHADNLSLAMRAAQFQALLANCEFTDGVGETLGLEAGIQRAMQILRRSEEHTSELQSQR